MNTNTEKFPLVIIEATEDSPKVTLDAASGKIEFSKRSLPEDAIAFYQPVLNWIKTYSQNPNSSTSFNMKLEYYNTSTAKQIFQLLSLLEETSKKSNVEVNWYSHKDDKDMHSAGERYSKMVLLKFNLLEY